MSDEIGYAELSPAELSAENVGGADFFHGAVEARPIPEIGPGRWRFVGGEGRTVMPLGGGGDVVMTWRALIGQMASRYSYPFFEPLNLKSHCHRKEEYKN